jgi:hypothetical protein
MHVWLGSGKQESLSSDSVLKPLSCRVEYTFLEIGATQQKMISPGTGVRSNGSAMVVQWWCRKCVRGWCWEQ